MQFLNKVASRSDHYGLVIVVSDSYTGRISKNVKSPINGLFEFPLINVEDFKYQLYA